jgi:S1-C subfamily serine protease
MGDEIKLTNGIISSKTGFQGDITSYQISAPVQPGNSGGPLFDKFGNLIGVINSKHSGAENVSYAVKISYLKNVIDLLPAAPKLSSTNTLTNLSLSDQVKLLNKFVYIIEIN